MASTKSSSYRRGVEAAHETNTPEHDISRPPRPCYRGERDGCVPRATERQTQAQLGPVQLAGPSFDIPHRV